MPDIEKSAATLQIGGEGLDPAEITKNLGIEPTHAWFNGQQIAGRRSPLVVKAKFGLWRFRSVDCEPENLENQIHEILEKTTHDLTIWQTIGSRYKVELFCGLYLDGHSGGLNLSSKSLALLAQRGIDLDLDIYAGDDEKSL